MKTNKYSDLSRSEIIHTFEYYDFPLFFISKSPYDELLLNYYIEEVGGKIDKWLFSKITGKELNKLIEQRLSVLELLKKLYRKKRLYYLYLNSKGAQPTGNFNLELVNKDNFDEESFPEEDFYVEYDYVTKSDLVKVEEDWIDSSQFKMVLKDPRNSHDIGLDIFLDVMGNLKRSINDIANDIVSNIIGEKSSHTINLRVDSLQPSSFGVVLKTEPLETDLFEIPERSLNNLFELIDDIHYKSPAEIEEQLELEEDYSLETIKSVQHLLKNIVENNFSLTLEGNTKTKNVERAVNFNKDSYGKLHVLTQILKEKSEISTEEIDVEGVLISINTTRNRFRISTTSIGEIGGKMSKEIIRKLKEDKSLQFKVPSLIKATVEKEVVRDYVEDNFFENFTLLHFEQPE